VLIGSAVGCYNLVDTIQIVAGTNCLQVTGSGCLTDNGTAVGGGGGGAFSVVPGYGGFPNIYSCVSGTSAGSYSCNNFFVGYCAGKDSCNSRHNNFIGQYAGQGTYYGTNNNYFGCRAGSSSYSGSDNNFLGSQSGCANTSGKNNNFFGRETGRSNTSGSYNNFIGQFAGTYNTTGSHNTFIGQNAGRFNGYGYANTYIGCDAGRYAYNGTYNIIMGSYTGCYGLTNTIHLQAGTNSLRLTDNGCLTVNGTPVGGGGGGAIKACQGSYGPNIVSCNSGFYSPPFGNYASNNFVVGQYTANSLGYGYAFNNNILGTMSGQFMASGSNNNFIGISTGRYNSGGCDNNFIGNRSGQYNTTGSLNNFIGSYAGNCNTSGENNNFLGTGAGRENTTGSDGVFIGFLAGRYNTNGTCNVFIGRCAGHNNTEGCNNLAFGVNSGTTGGAVCGLFNLTTTSNRIVMGNFSHTCAQIKIPWTAISDIRDKYIFGSVPHGRGFLQNIETIEYAFKDRETGCITDTDGKRRYGFSAQNVLAAESDKPVIVSTEDPENLQLTSDYIVPVLVNAVNELSQELEQLKVRLANLEAKQ
jgi:hypothetical protein